MVEKHRTISCLSCRYFDVTSRRYQKTSMSPALSNLAIVISVLMGLIQLSAIAHAHEAAIPSSQPAASAALSVKMVAIPDRIRLFESDGTAEIQVHCSGVFLAGDPIEICLPVSSIGKRPFPANSDMAALPTNPDPPPPRFRPPFG